MRNNCSIFEYSHLTDVIVTFIVFSNNRSEQIKARNGSDASKFFLEKYPQDELVEVDQLPFE